MSPGVKALHWCHCGGLATILAKASTDRYHAPQEVNVFVKTTVRTESIYSIRYLALDPSGSTMGVSDDWNSICTMS